MSALVSGGAVEAANDVLLVDLLRRCLDVNPDERITANDAIRHDSIRKFSNRPITFESNRIRSLLWAYLLSSIGTLVTVKVPRVSGEGEFSQIKVLDLICRQSFEARL